MLNSNVKIQHNKNHCGLCMEYYITICKVNYLLSLFDHLFDYSTAHFDQIQMSVNVFMFVSITS